MKDIRFLFLASMLAVLPLSAGPWEFDVESGSVFSGYNDVRIPGKGGTLFSLSEDLATDPSLFARVRVTRSFGRHSFSVLAAPLRLEASGEFEKPVSYRGSVFPAGVPVKGTYRFDSWRLTWRYALVKRPRFDAALGFTAKIRDAEIGLSSEGMSETKTNIGFVPIVHFRLCWKPNTKVNGLLEGDALAAPQGRAEDVFGGLVFTVHPALKFKAGYRILEGGADNDKVYTFSLFHYLSAGVIWTI
jgi:hypothetical protein